MSNPEGLAKEICGNCKWWDGRDEEDIIGRCKEGEITTKIFWIGEGSHCSFDPSRFSPYAPERSLGEGISGKDVENG